MRASVSKEIEKEEPYAVEAICLARDISTKLLQRLPPQTCFAIFVCTNYRNDLVKSSYKPVNFPYKPVKYCCLWLGLLLGSSLYVKPMGIVARI